MYSPSSASFTYHKNVIPVTKDMHPGFGASRGYQISAGIVHVLAWRFTNWTLLRFLHALWSTTDLFDGSLGWNNYSAIPRGCPALLTVACTMSTELVMKSHSACLERGSYIRQLFRCYCWLIYFFWNIFLLCGYFVKNDVADFCNELSPFDPSEGLMMHVIIMWGRKRRHGLRQSAICVIIHGYKPPLW